MRSQQKLDQIDSSAIDIVSAMNLLLIEVASGKTTLAEPEVRSLVQKAQEALSVAEAIQLLVTKNPRKNELKNLSSSVSPKQNIKPAANITKIDIKTLPKSTNGRRKYDPVYDFVILESLRVFAQRQECLSKEVLCNMLRIYDSSSDDQSVSTKLNSWHEDKFGVGGNNKGYVDWVRPKTNDLRITGRGEIARKDLFKFAKSQASHISNVFEQAYGFPHSVEPS